MRYNITMSKNYDKLGMFIVALLFGFSYSFQSLGARYIGPFAFNVGKYVVALVTLIPFALHKTNTNRKKEILFGLVIAAILTAFSFLQQIVAANEEPGKVGFITTMYIVEVPLINFLFFKKKVNLQTVLGIIMALGGLFFLCDLRNLSFRLSDLITFASSLLLALEIIVLDRYCGECDTFKLNFYNFAFSLLFCIIGFALSNETFSIAAYKPALPSLLYVGFGCSTVACSIQFYCQKTLDGVTTSLILALQSVFSAFAGYIIFDEKLSRIELIGCALMFIGVVLCITNQNKKIENKEG